MSAQRFGGAGEGARASFVPLRGWEKVALQGLLECVAPFIADGPLCIEDVKAYALDALEFADRHFTKHGGADPHGLSRDEVASINFYTKENLGDSE